MHCKYSEHRRNSDINALNFETYILKIFQGSQLLVLLLCPCIQINTLKSILTVVLECLFQVMYVLLG